jgi:hypothetical protein
MALLAAAWLAIGPPSVASASSSWRCGTRLVQLGSAPAEIHRRCGPPTDRSWALEYVPVRVSGGGGEILRAVAVEVWTYNRGPRQFVRYLTFRDGRLADVCEGWYGY